MYAGVELPDPGRLANTYVYDVTSAASEFHWPRQAVVTVSVPTWYRSVSWPSEADPFMRAATERSRLRSVLAWTSLVLARSSGGGVSPVFVRFTVHCRGRLRGIPVLCPLAVRVDQDSDRMPTIAVVTPDAD